MTEMKKENEGHGVEDNVDPAMSPYLECELPTGLLDDEGVLHKEVVLQEMTGEEEDILTARNKGSMSQRMQLILERCVVRIGSIDQSNPHWGRYLKTLVVTDRLFLMIRVRMASLGASYSFITQCPEDACQHKTNQTVNLEDFKVQGLKKPMERTWKGTLPRSKKSYTAKVQTGVEEDKMAKAEGSDDAASVFLSSRLVELGGVRPVTLEMVKKLTMVDRQFIRKELQEREGDIDNVAEVTCPRCGHEFKTAIEIGVVGFFFPSATPNS